MSKAENIAESGVQKSAFQRQQFPRWLKWTGRSLLVFFAAVGLFLALLPMGLNQRLVRERLESQIAAWSGMTLAVRGEAAISFFPFRATLTDVTSVDALGAVTVSARRLEARFSLLSVLTGSAAVKELLLDGAQLTLRQQAGIKLGDFAESGPLKPAIDLAKSALVEDRSSPDLTAISNMPLGKVRFSNSSIAYIWKDGREDLISDFSGVMQWQRLRGSAMASGSGTWRGEAVEMSADVGNPLVLAAGGTSTMRLRLQSAPLVFAFDGAANLAADFFAEGNLELKAASISRVLSWSAVPMTASGALGALDLSAKLTTAEGKLKFGDLRLALDGNPASGTMEFDPLAAAPRLSGTFAFEKVDLASIGQSLPLGAGSAAGSNSPLKGIDLDLRLSAETAAAGTWVIGAAAGTIRVDGDDLLLDLGNGELAGGTISASLRIEGAQPARRALLKFSARDVMPDQLGKGESGYPQISAPLTLAADLAGPFNGWSAFLQTGQGNLTGELGAGPVRNFSASGFAAAVAAGQTFALPDSFSGLSTIQSGQFAADLAKGAALVRSGELALDGLWLGLSGAIAYQTGGVAISGHSAAGPGEASPAPFFVGGSWEKPFVTLVQPPK